jgi:hypothetical protein
MSKVVWGTALALGVLCVVTYVLGGEFLYEAAFQLACGWALFLYRVLPEITVDPAGVLTALVCLILLGGGLHWFMRWLYAKVRQARPAPEGASPHWRMRWTGMILALVVLAFVAGISAVGLTHQTAWLFRSGPLVGRLGWRQVNPKTMSSNNLKGIGIGLHNRHDDNQGRLPPGGTFDEHGNALHGWQTLLLPYIEQDRLYEQIDLEAPWNAPRNVPHFRQSVKPYLHPAGGEKFDDSGLALSHYAANVRLMGAGPGWKLSDITDGTSNTIMAGEVWAAYRPWGHPRNWRDPAAGIHTTPDSFGSPMKPDYAQFLMADGSVRSVYKKTSPDVLKALSTPNGGEQLPPSGW